VIVLLATGWHLSTGQLGIGDGDSPQPPQVASVQPPNDSDQPPVDLIDEVELFATAYQGLSSPVSQLETLENERQVLLNYLISLEVSMEKQ